jgi:hypothetical protein
LILGDLVGNCCALVEPVTQTAAIARDKTKADNLFILRKIDVKHSKNLHISLPHYLVKFACHHYAAGR